jgi:hypothetical protein
MEDLRQAADSCIDPGQTCSVITCNAYDIICDTNNFSHIHRSIAGGGGGDVSGAAAPGDRVSGGLGGQNTYFK